MTVQRWFRTPALCAAALLSAICAAQELPQSLESLRHGPLTVWVIGPARLPNPTIVSNYALTPPTPMTYHEQPSGSFGQSASSFGQNAGSYGSPSDTAAIATPKAAQGENAPPPAANGIGYRQQTAGSFGQTSSSYGTTASSHGQNAASFGQNAGSVGTNASDHGQDAGSFGNSLSTIAGAGTRAPATPESHARVAFADALRGAFPEIQVKYKEVAANELKDRLAAAEGTADYPDVLVGPLPRDWGMELQSRFLLQRIQAADSLSDGLGSARSDAPVVSILLRGPHSRAARSLALWAAEAGSHCAGCLETDAESRKPYAEAAAAAIGKLLHGVAVGDLADADMAAFPAVLGRQMLAVGVDSFADDGSARVEIIKATSNGRLAAVSLRVLVASDQSFGLAHPLVVMRQGKGGQWRVLHVSLNLPAVEEIRAPQALMNFDITAVAERRAGVIGVKLASPPDGDSRPPTPELSWDNGGGAGLQVVEWQSVLGDGWSDARLFLIPDRAPRLKTQITASFAVDQTRYRWRVWSVGAGGEIKISPWRTLNIMQ